jgi:hypothetical protein
MDQHSVILLISTFSHRLINDHAANPADPRPAAPSLRPLIHQTRSIEVPACLITPERNQIEAPAANSSR